MRQRYGDPLMVVAGDYRFGAVDRMRKPRQFVAGKGERSRAGDCGAAGDRSVAWKADHAASFGESVVGAFRSSGRGAFSAGIKRALVAFLTTRGNALFVGLQMNWRVLGFMTGVSLLTCLLFGLAPALRATSVAPASAMRTSGRGLTAGQGIQSPPFFGGRADFVVISAADWRVAVCAQSSKVDGYPTWVPARGNHRRQPGSSSGALFERTVAASLSRASRSSSAPDRSCFGGASWLDTGERLGLGQYLGGRSSAPRRGCMFNRAGPGYFKAMETPFGAGPRF